MFEKILCIDDDAIAIMLCKKVITKFEFAKEIVVAKNGLEALDYFREISNSFEIEDKAKNSDLGLIFLDLNMPIMGGWEFLDNYTSHEYNGFNKTPVIILSSTIDPSDVARAKKYPIVMDFLSKPITFEMLEYLKSKISSFD